MPKIIDMHCDTVTKLAKNGKSFVHNDEHISLEKLQQADYMLQCFAIFINGKTDFPYFASCEEYIRVFRSFMQENDQAIRQVTTTEEILCNSEEGIISALLTIEGGEAIEGDLNKLQHFYDEGVRMMTLTWNYENEIGYPNYVYEHKVDEERGLKPFGFETIDWMWQHGMIVDVSHLNDAGFYDVMTKAEKPIVASHSNARAVHFMPRNMSDDMIMKLAANGGIMGMNYCPDFVSANVEENQIPALLEHIDHIVKIGGIDVVALGSDFDGIPTPVGLSDASKMPELYEALKQHGYSEEAIDKIFYKNFLRVLKANEV